MKIACPCGQDHSGSPAFPAVQGLVDHLGESVAVRTAGGAWQVPRVWIAFHGVREEELPKLAAKYGWPMAPARAAARGA